MGERMNQIDKKFKNLMKVIEMNEEQELFLSMKENYLQVNPETRKSIEAFFLKFPYWGTLDYETNDFHTIECACKVLKENVKSFQEFYDDLEDYRSKTILFAILNNWYCYDFVTLNRVMERMYLHYFDLDIIPECKNEFFVDLGAYTGDTIDEFVSTYGVNSFEKIYAYEMSEDSIKVLKEKTKDFSNIIARNCAVSDTKGVGSVIENLESASANVLAEGEDIVITTLDEDIKDKITILKMDIEGSETKALLGAKKHITLYKPKLMISIYHGFEDVIQIYKLLKSWNLGYKFYLRYYGGPIFPTEIVLYAI